jgi:hypothetical protein
MRPSPEEGLIRKVAMTISIHVRPLNGPRPSGSSIPISVIATGLIVQSHANGSLVYWYLVEGSAINSIVMPGVAIYTGAINTPTGDGGGS